MEAFFLSLPAETYTSLMVMVLISILSFMVYFQAKKVDPLSKPKGFLLVVETFIVTIEKLTIQNMGKHLRYYTPYFLAISLYVFISFIFGLTGLPSPLSYYLNTFTIVLLSFILIHFTAVKTNGWRYFKRYVEPFAVFLPINLISVWAPLISMSFRIFGNILSGFILMSLVYYSLGNFSAMVFSFLPAGFNTLFFAPLVAPWLHLYFDLFSAFIQTLVFISLSMLFIAQEGPAVSTTSETKIQAPSAY
jgi:F-type H+-transporting ATPase subunit a